MQRIQFKVLGYISAAILVRFHSATRIRSIADMVKLVGAFQELIAETGISAKHPQLPWGMLSISIDNTVSQPRMKGGG
jgi:hypothetical protein